MYKCQTLGTHKFPWCVTLTQANTTTSTPIATITIINVLKQNKKATVYMYISLYVNI